MLSDTPRSKLRYNVSRTGMIELIGRGGLPFQLSSGQAMFVLVLLAALALAGVALLVLDGAVTRLVEAILRARGHGRPKKSRFRVALDAMDEEMRKPKP